MSVHNRKRNSFDYRQPDVLSSQINELKQISIDIGTELDHQKRMMRDMDSDMSSAGVLLEKMTKGVGVLIEKVKGDKKYWVMILFLFLSVLYLYSRYNK
jgi:hypothetical protein